MLEALRNRNAPVLSDLELDVLRGVLRLLRTLRESALHAPTGLTRKRDQVRRTSVGGLSRGRSGSATASAGVLLPLAFFLRRLSCPRDLFDVETEAPLASVPGMARGREGMLGESRGVL